MTALTIAVAYLVVGVLVVRYASRGEPIVNGGKMTDTQARAYAVVLWPAIVGLVLFYVAVHVIGRAAGGKS